MTLPGGSDVGGEKAPLEAGGSSESEVVVAEVAGTSVSFLPGASSALGMRQSGRCQVK